MRGAPMLYPVVNVAHLLGLVLLVGGIGLLDLRIAGPGRAIPLVPLSRFLTPFAVVGLLVSVSTGALMFTADAAPLAQSPVFLWKIALAALALANALVFRRLFRDLAREPGPLARTMAVASLALWTTVAVLGRLIGYA
jgi:hypothetical protein